METTARDIPSPIDLRSMDDARAWAAAAEGRAGRDETLTRLVAEAAAMAGPAPRILELGSGPGFLARRLLERLPGARYTALDFSPAMHALARERLAGLAADVTYLVRSFKSADWPDGLGPFDLVVTNQAVHELRHKRYAQALHRQVHGVLAGDGSYLVSDHHCDEGGLANAELYMTKDEQRDALLAAGFAAVDRLLTAGSLVLHRAQKG